LTCAESKCYMACAFIIVAVTAAVGVTKAVTRFT
jgi:hypothetical protein